MIPFILSILTYFPILVAFIIIFFMRKDQSKIIKYLTTGALFIDFLISIPLFIFWDEAQALADTGGKMWVFEEGPYEWIKSLGVTYHFGIDGMSMLLVLLTTFLGFISAWSSWKYIHEREKEYYVWLLILQAGMLGVFCSLDFFLFYVFWEVMLVPMYFLIGIWGGPNKLYAAIKFFLYTLAGSVLMLIGILTLYFQTGTEGHHTFNLDAIIKLHIAPEMQWWVFLAFFIGFAIKVPMFPFHTWLPDAHVEAPTAGSVILAGVLLKMGTYGFLRFSLPILPDATIQFLPFMLVLSVIGIIYGAMVAMVQKDVKKLVAYSSVSHLGFCMLGIFALNPNGLKGGILQMINHGISTGALFLLVGIVYERTHTRLIKDYGGISKSLPVYATFFMIITLSSIGLPGLNGFVGEVMILMGAIQIPGLYSFHRLLPIFAVSGMLLGAAYMLWMYQRVFFGKITNEKNTSLEDMNGREWGYMIPLVIMTIWIGIYPKPFLTKMDRSVDFIIKKVTPSLEADLKKHGMKLPSVYTAPVSLEEEEVHSKTFTPEKVNQ